MKLKYKSFKLCTDILKFVEDKKIDVNNIISISTSRLNISWHYLWWKEGEKDGELIKEEKMSLYSMEEICSGCIHANWHRCCDTFCYCENTAQDEDINHMDGTCKLKTMDKNEER